MATRGATPSVGPRRGPATVPILAALVALVAGAAIGFAPDPRPVVLAVGGLMVVGAVWALWGATGLLAMVFGGAALIPVVASGTGQPSGLENVRSLLIGALVIGAAVVVGRARPGLPARGVRTGLAAMALIGVAVTAYSSADAATFGKAVMQAAGQPLIYMALLWVLMELFREDPRAKEKLVAAWCFAVVLEAVVVAGQYATGSAYDVLRGYQRAQGTMGSDFVGVFGAMGIFAGAYLRTVATSQVRRLLGNAAIVAGIVCVIGSVSRASLLAVGVAVFALMLGVGSDRKAGVRIVNAAGIAVLAALALLATQGIWEARLNATSTRAFDRPATWISGLRIAADHPFTGVGPTQVADVVLSNPRYSFTSVGLAGSNPHNAWLFVADAEGIPYALILIAVTLGLVIAIRQSPPARGRRYLLASLTAGGTVFVVNNLFNHPEIMVYICLASAALLAAPRRE